MSRDLHENQDTVDYAEEMEIYQPIKQLEDQSRPIDLGATAGDNGSPSSYIYIPSSSSFTDKFSDGKAPWTGMLRNMVTKDD